MNPTTRAQIGGLIAAAALASTLIGVSASAAGGPSPAPGKASAASGFNDGTAGTIVNRGRALYKCVSAKSGPGDAPIYTDDPAMDGLRMHGCKRLDAADINVVFTQTNAGAASASEGAGTQDAPSLVPGSPLPSPILTNRGRAPESIPAPQTPLANPGQK